ncbi:MAG TPA: hypothetical protein VK427_22020, partial [Kofleriaceae bacterium]|nr:hypothetical protein [Kofleriaceae bacterium]
MKTLTEFSTLTLRKAAEARAAVSGAAAPSPAPAADAASPDSEAAAAEGASEADGGGSGAIEGDEGGEAGEGIADAAGSEGEAQSGEAVPATSESDPVVQALATQLGVQPDRAARLMEALDIVGNRIDQVRLVRVFQGEAGPHGAVSRGEFHYVIDRVAGPSRGGSRDDRRGGGDRGGRGGGDRGGRGGGGGGGGGGFGGDRGPPKPRGLGSLKIGAPKEEKKYDDRP